jgi:hypothetical protein
MKTCTIDFFISFINHLIKFGAVFASKIIFTIITPHQTPSSTSSLCRNQYLLGHVGEGLGEVLLAEGKLANGPDLGVLPSC